MIVTLDEFIDRLDNIKKELYESGISPKHVHVVVPQVDRNYLEMTPLGKTDDIFDMKFPMGDFSGKVHHYLIIDVNRLVDIKS